VARIEGDRAVEGSFCRLDLVSLARDRAQIVVCVGVGLETMRLLEGRGGVVDPLVFEQQYAEVQVGACEVRPQLDGAALLVDLETGQRFEVTPEYAKTEYGDKLQAHLTDLRERAQGAGLDYFLLPTDRPLDVALREYLRLRQGRN